MTDANDLEAHQRAQKPRITSIQFFGYFLLAGLILFIVYIFYSGVRTATQGPKYYSGA
jgi:hypothetical protein